MKKVTIRKINKIAQKLLVIILLVITLSFIPMQSIAVGDAFRQNVQKTEGGKNSLLDTDYKGMIQDGEFYYRGVPEGHYVKNQFNLWKWIVNLISEIFDYLLGLATMGLRLGVLGWGILIEVILTNSLDSLVVKNVSTGNARKGNLGFYTDSKKTVNVENLFFNRVEALNVNFFETKESVKARLTKYNPTGLEYESLGEEQLSDQEIEEGPLLVIKDYFAKIFLLFYMFGIVLFLIGLLINALMAVVESIGSKKAAYKKRAKAWLRAVIEMALLILYIIFILQVHTWIIDSLSNFADKLANSVGGSYMQTDMGRNYTIMETLRTRAYSFKFSVGFPAAIMYIILIWYTFKFFLIYVKRFLVVFFLSILGPILMGYDLILSAIRGKSSVRIDWIKEFTFNVLIQIIHAFVYLIFIPVAYSLASTNIMGFVLMFMILKFLLESEKIIRQVFNIRGARNHSTLENVLQNKGVKQFVYGSAAGYFVGQSSVTSKYIKKYTGKVVRPFAAAATTATSSAFRGAYNLSQSIRERRVDRRREAGLPDLTDRQIRRDERRDQRVKDLLKLKGYSEQEIKDRFTAGSGVTLTEQQKDFIRLLEVGRIKKTSGLIKGVNKVKYSSRRFSRVLSDMTVKDEYGRKRLEPGVLSVNSRTGKIQIRDGLKDKFRKAVIKEFKLGKGKEGKIEYQKALGDIKRAGKAGLKTAGGLLFFPVSFADPTVPTTIYAGLMNNFEVNSNILQREKKLPAGIKSVPTTIQGEYKGIFKQRMSYKEYLKDNKKAFKQMKKGNNENQ